MLAALLESGEALHACACGTEGCACAEDGGGFFVIACVGGEECEGGVDCCAFDCACGECAGSAHGLDYGGVGEFAGERSHLWREGLIGGEACGCALDADELAGPLEDFFEGLRDRGICQHGSAGGLVEPIGGVGGFAEDDFGGACSGLDFAEDAEACFVDGVEPGDGGGDLGRCSYCGSTCGDTSADADIFSKVDDLACGGDITRREACGVGDDIGEALCEGVVAFYESACGEFYCACGFGAGDLPEAGEANCFGSCSKGNEVRGVGDHFDDACLGKVWCFLLVAAGEHAGEKLGGRGLCGEVLVFGIDAFFLDVVFEFVVLQILFVCGTNWLIRIPLLEPGQNHWVLRLGKQKLSGGLVDVLRLAIQSLFDPSSELHGTEGSAADAGLHCGWGFGEGFGRRVEGGVEGIECADKQSADGFGGEFGIAWDFALCLEAFLGGLLVEILVACRDIVRIVKGGDDHFVHFVLSVSFRLVCLLKLVDFFGRVFTIFKLGNRAHSWSTRRRCPLTGDQPGRSCFFRRSACGDGRRGVRGKRLLHRQLGCGHGIHFFLGIFPVLKGGRIERDSICHWEV